MATKKQLITAISDDSGFLVKDIEPILESFFIVVKQHIGVGEEVVIRGFGKFYNQKRAEKTGRDVNANTPLRIPAQNKVAFKPYDEFIPAKLKV